MIAAAEPAQTRRTVQRDPEEQKVYLQKTISASRLGLWLQCRLKFYFRYIAQIQKPTTPAKHAGSTVHAVLQNWNLSRWRRQPFEIERFKLLFESQWVALQAGVKIAWDGEEYNERQTSRPLLVTIQAAPFSSATPAFVVEASHPAKSIRNAFAFTQGQSEGPRAFTVVPVQHDGGRVRAMLPQQPKGQTLSFVLEFEGDGKADAKGIGKAVVLRPLQ